MRRKNSSMLIGNRYEMLSKLGEGAMGAVFRVHDRLTDTELALKQVKLPDDVGDTKPSSVYDPLMALANEFQTLASLRHPHVIAVLDYGFDEERRPYFTMPLLQGAETLLEAAEEISFQRRIDLLIQLLRGLAYIHRRGILHRDLKPNNVLVRDNHVYVLDFGLAAQREGMDSSQTVGTLTYIAPEVLMGQPSSESADLYAVGIIAFEMLSGRHPYETDSTAKLINSILQTAIDVFSLDIPVGLKSVLATLLDKTPENRYSDATQVIEAICDALEIPVPVETKEIRESFIQAAEFVGRDKELATLKTALNDLATLDTGNAFLIGGESGIGKSRLIYEISTRALVQGILVLHGQMTSEGRLAYQLWRDILRRLLLMTPVNDTEASVLKTVLPGLPELLRRPVEDILVEDTMQKRLLLVIENIFRRVLEERPILLVLEDIHWATESLIVLEQLLPLVHELPLMIVGSYRNDERPDMSENLQDMQVITLERLHTGEIEQLSQSMLGLTGIRSEVIDLLTRETEGNVFFIVEVVRALAEEAGSLNEIGKATLPPSVFAGGVQRIVQRRLERVPEWAQDALHVAAIAGRQIDLALIQHALPDLDVNNWLTVCANAAVVDVLAEHWRFAHDKLREGVLAQITPLEKSRLHRAVAQAIEAIYTDYLDDYAAVLVYHWAKAGDEDKEGQYAALAADQMYHRNEYREMKRLYERALALKTYRNDPNPRKALADLMSGLGRATYTLSEYDAVIHWRESALEIYRELDATFGIAESIAALGEVKMRQGKNTESLPLVEESRKLYDSIGKRKKVAYADMNLGVIYSQMGDNEKALSYMQRCHEMMQEVGEPLDLARALNNLGVVSDLLGDLLGAKAYHNEALKIRRAINDRLGIAYSLANLGSLADLQGKLEEAEEKQLESLRLLRLLGEKMSQAIALVNLGDLYAKMNRFQDAERAYHEGVVLRKSFEDYPGVAQAIKGLANVARDQGETGRAWMHYLEALRYAEDAEAEMVLNGILFSIGQMLIALGHYAATTQIFAYLRKRGNFSDGNRLLQSLAFLQDTMPEAEYKAAVKAGEASTLAAMVVLARSFAPEAPV